MKWFEHDISRGIEAIIMRLKEYYWDNYEQALIRMIEQNNSMLSKLEEYYKFIATLNVDPCVMNRNDNQLLFSPEDDEYFKGYSWNNKIAKQYFEIYQSIKNKITIRDKLNLYSTISILLNKAEMNNMKSLNNILFDLINTA